MKRPDPPPLEEADLEGLRREATENLGLPRGHVAFKLIDQLARYPNETLYQQLLRIIGPLRESRRITYHRGDRTPPPDVLQNGIPVAGVTQPDGSVSPVCLQFSPLEYPHALACGLTGKGKTYLVRRILQFIATQMPWVRILLFDPNRSYAYLASDPAWLSVDWQNLRLNPIVPPVGYPMEYWMPGFVDVFARRELMHSKYLFTRRLDDLIHAAIVRTPTGADVVYPSLFDVREDLENMKCRSRWGREENHRESLLNVLDGRLRATSEVYRCAQGMEAPMTDTRVRISTEGLAPVETLQFFINNLIHYLYRRRSLAPIMEPPELHTLLVVEEAQVLLQKTAEERPLAYYQELMLKARAAGIGTLLIAQDIGRIDPVVLAAVSNYFLFAQSSMGNIAVAQKMLSLSNQEASLLGSLATGEVFIRFVGHRDWPYPFLARIPA